MGLQRRICVVYNPTARGEKAQRFQGFLQSLGTSITVRPTDAPGAARRIAREATLEGFDVVVAAGGDGTVNEVVAGIEDAETAWTTTALGILPLGTVNVFALELGIPFRLTDAWQCIVAGKERNIDLPSARWLANGVVQTRSFAQMAGAGLDSIAITQVRWEEKKKWGRFAYVLAGFRALKSELPQLAVKSHSPSRTVSGQLALVCNGRWYGGKFLLFPEAQSADGLLDIVVFPSISLWQLIRFVAGGLTGNVYRWLNVSRWQAPLVEIASEHAVPFELDGDNIGMLPVELTTAKHLMRVLVP